MKNITFHCLVWLFVLSISFLACKGKKGLSGQGKKQGDSCGTLVTVKNFRGLGGCQFLLEMEDGGTLMPVQISVEGQDHSVWEKTQQARIDYTIQEGMNNCMRGKMVEITCLEIVREGIPQKGDF